MLTVLIRTLILYAALIGTMRFMGKRQLGELEVSDLVTALLLSEIASLPITNPEVPLSHALVPILALMSLEVLLSGAILKIPFVKRLFSVHPTMLIRHGKPDIPAMQTARISSEELLSQLRQKEVSDLDEVEFAILEPNGQISIIRKDAARPPTLQELGVSPQGSGLMHLIISDGQINHRSLALTGRDERWLEKVLRAQKLTVPEVFLLLADENGRIRIFPRKEKAS